MAEKIRKNRLLELRTRSRLTQEEVARILNCDFTLVSHHENLTRAVTQEDIAAYAKLYKVSELDLFVDKAKEFKKS